MLGKNRQDYIYEEQILSFFKKIEENRNPVLIFGASKAGWFVIKVLERNNIKIAGIIDNDEEKHGFFLNYMVKPLSEIDDASKRAIVILGVMSPKTAEQVEKQLFEKGFSEINYLMDAFLYFYFINVAGRKCQRTIFAESIRLLFEHLGLKSNVFGLNERGRLVSPYVTGYLTQKCNLRCRNCGSLIPYYKSPKTFALENIVSDINVYAKAFDVVPEISFSGGEPFLHPDFHKVCEIVSEIPNIIFINITTNGTLVPTDDQLKTLNSCGADIHQSDYGSLSKNQDKLFKKCEEYGIYCDINFVNENHRWFSRPIFSHYNRGENDNDLLFQSCIASNCFCCQLMDGELHRCPASLNGTHQKLIQDVPQDYVKLHTADKSHNQLAIEIANFIQRRKALQVCTQCNLWEDEMVVPAVQFAHNHDSKSI